MQGTFVNLQDTRTCNRVTGERAFVLLEKRVVAKPVAAIEDATLGCNCVTPLHRLLFARKPNTWTSGPGLTPGDG